MYVKMNIASSEDTEVYFRELRSRIEKRSRVLNAFCLKESWTRSDVSRLKSVTKAYNAVIDLEAQIVAAHNDWMEFVKAENKNILESTFRDEIFSAYLIEMGHLFDITNEKFKSLFEAYPSQETVRGYT